MRIFITGATGFIGRALFARLRRDGHTIVVWTRSPARARAALGAEQDALSTDISASDLTRALSGVDAVINLAGKNLISGRWNQQRKQALCESRVSLTTRLVEALGRAEPRPAVLISASAVGFYGDGGDQPLDESASQGDGFLAELSQAWEQAARGAERHGVRVVLPRFGVVLGPEDGALARMLPVFRAGLGGRLGSGRQQLPWVHLADLVEVLVSALSDERYQGPINVVAPNPVTNAELTRELGRLLRRPALLWVPALLLRLVLGEAASVLLASQRVVPRRLTEHGFAFRFPLLGQALEDILGGAKAPSIAAAPAGGPSELPGGTRPRYLLEQSTTLEAPQSAVFAFFSKAENLGLLTPPWMDLRIEGPVTEPLQAGAEISYKLRLGPVSSRWRTLLTVWEPGSRFVDLQASGPYRLWWHEHSFFAEGDKTRMVDRVFYRLPYGPAGRLAHWLVVGRLLRRIFAYRASLIDLRFGPGEASAASQLAVARPLDESAKGESQPEGVS